MYDSYDYYRYCEVEFFYINFLYSRLISLIVVFICFFSCIFYLKYEY